MVFFFLFIYSRRRRGFYGIFYFYCRFFPEGRVLMLTSTDDAKVCVGALRNRSPKGPTILVGHYRLYEDSVTLVLKRQKGKGSEQGKNRNDDFYYSSDQTFHMVRD